MDETLIRIFTDYTLRTVALGAAVLGAVAGALGAFAMLRRQSLLGDAVSHAALPGIALAFMLTGSKAPLILVLGAAAAGWIGALCVMGIVRATRLPSDTALGLVLSVFFGFGMVLLTFIQRRPDAAQAGLDRYLFGQAASMLRGDVATMAILGGAALAVLALFWKEFKLLAFDPGFAAVGGLPVRALDVILTALLVIAIVIGLQAVGVVLMSALIVAPAAAARQWTDRLGPMVVISGLFGALAGVTGAVVSSLAPRVPTGPAIVLCAVILVTISLLAAPGRGVLWQAGVRWRNRRRLRIAAVLLDLRALARQHDDPTVAHPVPVLKIMGERGGVRRSLAELRNRGLAEPTGDGAWRLTPAGVAAADAADAAAAEEER